MKKQMQNRMRVRLTGVCLLGLCLSGGAATDGYYWPDWIYDLNPWGTIRYWEGDRVPGDFAAVDGLRGRWIWGRTGNEWHLQSAGMAVIIR